MATADEAQIGRQSHLRRVLLSAIRRDGNTQHRMTEDVALIAEYAGLMRDGVEFPPVRLWWDGASYWLSDGFRRVAAADMAGLSDVAAEVRLGDLSDARWDSYAANATHGTRRSAPETEAVIRLALDHPNSRGMSNCELARHLQVSESTVRCRHPRLSSRRREDAVRMATRKGTTYPMATGKIGRHSQPRVPKTRWCRRNLPNVRALAAQARDRYGLIGLSSTTTKLQEYLKSANMDFPVYALDLSRLPEGFDAALTPQTALVRPDGSVVKVWQGAYTGKRKQEIEALFRVKLPGIAE